MVLTTTLTAAAAAALINCWLMFRCGQIRKVTKILHGDDDHPLLIRRMRAQSNFIESTPFVLILIAGIELAGRGGQWLSFTAAFYMLLRIAHAVGMDRSEINMFRMAGTMTTLLTQLGLSAAAVAIALGKF